MEFTPARSRARLRIISRCSALALLCLSTLLSQGCFGRFPLTSKLYEINSDVSEVEFHQNLAFWGMLIVYPGALVVDMLVMNTIEFWSSEEPYYASNVGYPAPIDRFSANPALTQPITSRPTAMRSGLAFESEQQYSRPRADYPPPNYVASGYNTSRHR